MQSNSVSLYMRTNYVLICMRKLKTKLTTHKSSELSTKIVGCDRDAYNKAVSTRLATKLKVFNHAAFGDECRYIAIKICIFILTIAETNGLSIEFIPIFGISTGFTSLLISVDLTSTMKDISSLNLHLGEDSANSIIDEVRRTNTLDTISKSSAHSYDEKRRTSIGFEESTDNADRNESISIIRTKSRNDERVRAVFVGTNTNIAIRISDSGNTNNILLISYRWTFALSPFLSALPKPSIPRTAGLA